MNVKPWQALVIIVFYGAWIGAAVWAGGQWREYQAPGFLHVNQQGHLLVTVRDQLLEYNPQGALEQVHALHDLGVDKQVTGFGFFANGDVLLRPGAYTPTLAQNLLRFFRFEGSIPSSTTQRLQRCSLDDGYRCVDLPGLTRELGSLFRIAIDASDAIFIADTQEQAVLWLDSDGKPVDAINSGLTFPNQVVLHGDTLAIANTNHHEILLVPLVREAGKPGRFSDRSQWQRLEITRANNPLGTESWPSDMAFLDGHWFALVHDNSMMQGTVYRFDARGKPDKRFALEPGSDNVALLAFNGELLVADWKKLQLRRYSSEGILLGEFGSPEQAQLLAGLKDRQQHYTLLSRLCWAAFAVLLLAGLVVGGVLEVRRQQQIAAAKPAAPQVVPASATIKPHPREGGIVWLSPRRDMQVLFLWVLPLLIVVAPLPLLWLMYQKAQSLEAMLAKPGLLLPLASLLLITLPVVWLSRGQFKRRIGVKNEWLLLEDAQGQVAIGSGPDISVNRFGSDAVIHLRIGDISVALGQPHQRFFDKALLEQHVLPLLGQAHTLTSADHWAHFKTQLKKPSFLVMTGMMLSGMLLLVCDKYLVL